MKRKKLLAAALMGAGAAAVMLALWWAGALDGLEYPTWSWRARVFARPSAQSQQIKIILLDQASLDWGARENDWSWPWPREVYAPILQFCQRGGARAVGFDVLFTEPSKYGVADDEAFGAAIHASGGFVGALFLGRDEGSATAWPADLRPSPLQVANLDAVRRAADDAGLALPRATFPVPEVATNAALLADVKGEPDADGVIRRASLFRLFDGQVVPALGFGLYRLAAVAANIQDLEPLRLEPGWLHIGTRRVPLDRRGRMILCYRGTLSDVYRPYSAQAILQSELRLQAGGEPLVDPREFQDAYVLFGFSAPGLMDLRPTPISNVAPGVMVYATMLDNLLAMDPMREMPAALLALLVGLLACLGSAAVVFSRRAWHSVLCIVAFLALAVAAAFGAYGLGYWYPMVPQAGAVALALAGALVYSYATEGRQKAFIKGAFKHYLSPEVIDAILLHPEQLKLGGEKRELTIFFSDLQGFSSLSEKLNPTELTTLLNDYLTDMTNIILDEGGTLDKYEGDAIIAFWNAPLPQPDHARRACRAALLCQQKLAARREEFARRTGSQLYMRVGLHTGEVVVGNMGSQRRFDYTVLGDAANLASRLEGANKAFGTYTMASETTWLQTANAFVGRRLGAIRVVGRKTPVKVLELVALGGGEPPAVALFHNALGLCGARKWAEALAILQPLEQDPVARKYAAQCRELLASGGDWDGIWNLAEK